MGGPGTGAGKKKILLANPKREPVKGACGPAASGLWGPPRQGSQTRYL